MSFDLDLTTRRALVTGGTRGVGAAVVETLREAGAHVLAAARSIPARRTEGVRYIAADLSTLEGASGFTNCGAFSSSRSVHAINPHPDRSTERVWSRRI